MKLPANPTELSPLVAAPGRVRCTKCGYEDYAEVKPKGDSCLALLELLSMKSATSTPDHQ